MKLADWMHENRVTPSDLKGLLGLKSRMTVKRYLEGDRVPQERILQKLTDLTGGRVRRGDFLDPTPPDCAAVVPAKRGGTRLVFPWSCSDAAVEQALQAMLAGPPDHARPLPPLERAFETLGGRVALASRGYYLLDGRRTDARRVVAAANRVLEDHGEALIEYPSVHRREP